MPSSVIHEVSHAKKKPMTALLTSNLGPESCSDITEYGYWLQTHPKVSNWQAPNCMLHHYKSKDTSKCLANKRVVFIGDSTARMTFFGAMRAMNGSLVDYTDVDEKHLNRKLIFSDVSFEFVWDPLMDGEGLDFLKNTKPGDADNIAFVYISFGLWYVQKHHADSKDLFRKHLKTLSSILDNEPNKFSKVFISPVLVPFYEKLPDSRATDFQKPWSENLNEVIAEVFPSSTPSVTIPHVFNSLPENMGENYNDEGIQYTEGLADLEADILYNTVCNTAISDSYPYSKTCCLDYPKPRGTYLLVLLITTVLLPMFLVSNYFLRYWGAEVIGRSSKPLVTLQTVQAALLIFSLCLTYCFLCDRTDFFSKGNKNFQWSDFYGLCGVSLALGAFSLVKISNPKNATFLNRFQTDEWKGWMQIAILIYHITGGSKVLPIYKAIRVMVASYLFMTGYGHTAFFTKKGDFGLKRVVSVLCRLNMLTIFLAYVMNTDYLFYYFSPLVTFWFGVIWITYRILPRYNAGLVSSLLKVFISGIVIYLAVSVPGPLEAVFWIFSKVANISWDLREWRFRVMLDIWAVHAGMITSILVNHDELQGIREKLGKFRYLGAAVGTTLFVIYWVSSGAYDVKTEYNQVNKYISIFPILGFILLRNAPPFVGYYSTVFAWFGKISLETFILQFHIWMAADTKGVLYMIDMGMTNWKYYDTNSYQQLLHLHEIRHYANFILISIPFLLLSERISYASGVLTTFFVSPKDIFDNESKTLPHPVTGDSNEQIPLDNLSARDVPADKEGLLEGSQSISYSNSKAVRMLQKLGVVAFTTFLDLRARVLLVLVILFAMNNFW